MRARHIPNAISLARLAAVPGLLWLAAGHFRSAFVIVLLTAGLSDLLDGWLARRFGWTSELGSLLDSAADICLVMAAIYGIWIFHPEVLATHWLMVSAVLGIWLVVHAIALVRDGRLSSLHTRFIRFGMLLFGLFVAVLFLYDFVRWLFYLALSCCFLGGIQNLLMLSLGIRRLDAPGPPTR